VFSFGQNSVGQLGNGTNTNSTNAVVQATGLSSVTQLSDGRGVFYSLSGGTLEVWGQGFTNTPAAFPGVTSATMITAAGSTGYALLSNGTVMAWGDNTYGQLGQGNFTPGPFPTPTVISGLTNIVGISAGHGCCMFIDTSGNTWGVGYNVYGQLGNGNTTNQSSAVECFTTPSISQTANQYSGGGQGVGDGHSLAITATGEVVAWGNNQFGQLGDRTVTNRSSPVQVLGLPSTITQVSAGGIHSMALDSSNNLWVWGGNSFGQLGDGTVHCRSYPFQLLTGVSLMSAGSFHSTAFQP
jgi:alpha-tubulin suppressor-like RCC1 family protein